MRTAIVVLSLVLLASFTVNDAEARKKSRAKLSDIQVTKKLDKASSQLQKTKTTGAGAKRGNAAITVQKPPAAPPPQPLPYPNQAGGAAFRDNQSTVLAKPKGGKKLKYIEYKMNDVMISGASGGSQPPKGPRAGILDGGPGGLSTQGPAATGVPSGAAAPAGPMLR